MPPTWSLARKKQQEKGRRGKRHETIHPRSQGRAGTEPTAGPRPPTCCARSRCPTAGAGTGAPRPPVIESPPQPSPRPRGVQRAFLWGHLSSVLRSRQWERWSPWEFNRANGGEVPFLLHAHCDSHRTLLSSWLKNEITKLIQISYSES